MFDLLKILIEASLRALALPDLLKRKDQKKLKQIGANVFQLYTALNDIYITGTRISDGLERYLRWMKDNIERQPVDTNAYASRISFLLRYQSINIHRFVDSLERLKKEIQLISPETYISLPSILIDKARRVRLLMRMLADQRLLLSLQKWDTVSFGGQLESDHYEKVRSYVESSGQKEDLDYIKEAAINLRKAILENFLLQDILISISDDTAYWGDM